MSLLELKKVEQQTGVVSDRNKYTSRTGTVTFFVSRICSRNINCNLHDDFEAVFIEPCRGSSLVTEWIVCASRVVVE